MVEKKPESPAIQEQDSSISSVVHAESLTDYLDDLLQEVTEDKPESSAPATDTLVVDDPTTSSSL